MLQFSLIEVKVQIPGRFCLLFLFTELFVEIRVVCVVILAVQVVKNQAKAFTETLIVYNLSFAQIADRVTDFRIFDEAKNIIVGKAGFLLCCYLVRITKLKYGWYLAMLTSVRYHFFYCKKNGEIGYPALPHVISDISFSYYVCEAIQGGTFMQKKQTVFPMRKKDYNCNSVYKSDSEQDIRTNFVRVFAKYIMQQEESKHL